MAMSKKLRGLVEEVLACFVDRVSTALGELADGRGQVCDADIAVVWIEHTAQIWGALDEWERRVVAQDARLGRRLQLELVPIRAMLQRIVAAPRTLH